MLDVLVKLWEECGRLIAVRRVGFHGDPDFVTAVELEFEALTVVFRAIADNDTLSASFETLQSELEETILDFRALEPWSRCLGAELDWAWQLTNQQGYSDGVRLEFAESGGDAVVRIELIVTASAIQTFVSIPSEYKVKTTR